jgi:lipoprotein-releasing system permease protein
VDPAFWQDPGARRYLTVETGGDLELQNGKVYLGEDLARTLGAGPGTKVRLMTIETGANGMSLPRLSIFTVQGIVSSGYRALDSLWCLMTLADGKRVLPAASQHFLMVKIADPFDDADMAAARIEYTLDRDVDSNFRVYTWKELQASQYSSYESTRQMLLFIMALIVLIAAINVSSATSMLVIERRRDIAVMKACGAGPGYTCAVFVWSAFLTGLIGAVIGIAIGLLIGGYVNQILDGLERFLTFMSGLGGGGPVRILDSGYYLERIPVTIDGWAIFLIGLLTVLLSCLCSLVPARRAARLKPIEILQKH